MNQNEDELRWSASIPIASGLFALVVLFGGFFTWSITTEISGAIVSLGRVEVERNRQVVQHQSGGTVAVIAVEEGGMVQAGDALLRLDGRQLKSEKNIIDGLLFELAARRSRLTAERDNVETVTFDDELVVHGGVDPNVAELVLGQMNLFHARRDAAKLEVEKLETRVVQVGNEALGLEAQEIALKSQLGFIIEELKAQQSLFDRGLAQAGTVFFLERETAKLRGQLGELAAQKAQLNGLITEIDLEVLKLSNTSRENAITQLRDIRHRETELIEQRAALAYKINQLVVRAPVLGIVYGMRVHSVQSVLQPAEPILFLILQDRPLLIVTRIDPLHIDRIHRGKRVTLRFTALDQRTTSELEGVVSLVSADSFKDDGGGASYYRAEIFVEPEEMAKLAGNSALIPGMPVETFIGTADRSPLSYLLKPIVDYFNRAFRES